MKIVDTRTTDVRALLNARSMAGDAETERIVAEIIADVRRRGNDALLDNARRFDAAGLEDIHPSPGELKRGTAELAVEARKALEQVFTRVLDFHIAQGSHLFGHMAAVEDSGAGNYRWSRPVREGSADTGTVGQRFIPIESVGIYVPGGNAPYPSSVIMNAAPAIAAGVSSLLVATPAQRDGSLHPAVCAALGLASVAHSDGKALPTAGAGLSVAKMGGASAVAAMAFGTETISRVDKILGPGNRFVNEAKRQVWGYVGVDGQAGPSEVCVLADSAANAAYAAADLLTQIEHASDNVGFLITLSEDKLFEILAEIDRQVEDAPRARTLKAALAGGSLAIVARDLSEALDLINQIAPEHLSLMVDDPEKWVSQVRNAGCVLMGENTPESAADYCIGPSHTLPTNGAARWHGPLNVLDFVKVQSVARLVEGDLDALLPLVEAIGALENFPAHVQGATIRRTR